MAEPNVTASPSTGSFVVLTWLFRTLVIALALELNCEADCVRALPLDAVEDVFVTVMLEEKP